MAQRANSVRHRRIEDALVITTRGALQLSDLRGTRLASTLHKDV
jgi:hypothetical protein